MAGKADIVDHLAQAADMTKSQAGEAFDAMFEFFTDTLASGDRVQIAGFGSFSTVERAAREGRNPRTGEKIPIPASTGVRFKPGSNLKAAVND